MGLAGSSRARAARCGVEVKAVKVKFDGQSRRSAAAKRAGALGVGCVAAARQGTRPCAAAQHGQVESRGRSCTEMAKYVPPPARGGRKGPNRDRRRSGARKSVPVAMRMSPSTATGSTRAQALLSITGPVGRARDGRPGGKVSGQTFGLSPARPARFDLTRLEPDLEALHERLSGVTVMCLDYAEFIARIDRPSSLFFLVPPYFGCEGDYGKVAFSRADFEGAILESADLFRTQWQQANLLDASLVSANLEKAIFEDANLSGANLSAANALNADFKKAKFSNAILIKTQLDWADCTDAIFTNAKLPGASLFNTNLQGASLLGADFTDADLREADFENAQMEGVCLEGCKVRKAIFTGVTGLSEDQKIWLKENQALNVE